jgi:hypothetical protein
MSDARVYVLVEIEENSAGGYNSHQELYRDEDMDRVDKMRKKYNRFGAATDLRKSLEVWECKPKFGDGYYGN